MRELTLAMFATGAIKAKPLCLWCYAATQAGAEGVADLGLAPGQSTGNYHKHLKLVTGYGDEENLNIQYIDVPVMDKFK